MDEWKSSIDSIEGISKARERGTMDIPFNLQPRASQKLQVRTSIHPPPPGPPKLSGLPDGLGHNLGIQMIGELLME